MEVPFESAPLSPWTFHPVKQTLATIDRFGGSYFSYLYPTTGSANVPSPSAATEVVVGPRDYSFPPPTSSTMMQSPPSAVPDLRLPGPAAKTVAFRYVAALPLVVEVPVVEVTSALVVFGLQTEAAG